MTKKDIKNKNKSNKKQSKKKSSKKQSSNKKKPSNQKGGFKKFDYNSSDREIKIVPDGVSLKSIFKKSGVGNPPDKSCIIM